MAKLSSTLFALGVIATSVSHAQQDIPAVPVPPPVAPIAPAPLTPAPIDPPVPLPSVTPQLSAPAVLPEATLAPSAPSPNVARMHDFQGDEIGIVLRSLARQAGLTMIVSDKVATPGNTVTARIENKTPLEAIEIIVESKGLVMEERKGVVSVKTVEEKQREPAVSGSYTLSYGQAEKILPLLTTQLASGLPPQFDQRTNTVYFRETKSNMENILSFLLSIDRPTMQVMIEARLVEVNANPRQSYGINWAGIVGGSTSPQTLRYGGSNTAEPPTYVLDSNGVPRETPGKPATGIFDEVTGRLRPRDFFLDGLTGGNFGSALGGQFAILSVPQMSATVRLLNEDSDAEFLANPRVVTANNLKAKIQITRNQPVPQLNFNEQ
ncbi:MAG: secretin N-terminal domain-containing protein, partial [Verrucomicrobiota bacterium]